MGGAAHYYISDHLHSTSKVVSSAGALENDSDYFPFGGERQYLASVGDQHFKFTGKERDSESGLDYFGARYYSSTMGRWMSPDWSPLPVPIPFADFENPQSLNLFSYVKNNPTTLADLDGHSDLVYDGASHTISLYSSTGQKIGSWHANNNVDSKARFASTGKKVTPLPNGKYAITDQTHSHMHGNQVDPSDNHLKDSRQGEFGTHGIFRLAKGKFNPDGGIGVHAGRDGVTDATHKRSGPDHATEGCVRTTEDAMAKISDVASTDPLKALTVTNNNGGYNRQSVNAAEGQAAQAVQNEGASNPTSPPQPD